MSKSDTTPIPPWAPCKRPLGCDYPDCECHSQTTNHPVHLETPVATDEPILPNWKSMQFRDGVFVGVAIVLLPIFLWVGIHG